MKISKIVNDPEISFPQIINFHNLKETDRLYIHPSTDNVFHR